MCLLKIGGSSRLWGGMKKQLSHVRNCCTHTNQMHPDLLGHTQMVCRITGGMLASNQQAECDLNWWATEHVYLHLQERLSQGRDLYQASKLEKFSRTPSFFFFPFHFFIIALHSLGSLQDRIQYLQGSLRLISLLLISVHLIIVSLLWMLPLFHWFPSSQWLSCVYLSSALVIVWTYDLGNSYENHWGWEQGCRFQYPPHQFIHGL